MLRTPLRVLFSTLKRFGIQHEGVPDIPKIDFPVREYVEGEEQLTRQEIFEQTGYKKKTYPRCRYMAFEHRGRLYHIFDAARYPLGRMCGIIATQIRGKNTPLYKNNRVNDGATCIIVNATDPLITGKKLLWKTFRYHTGFIGHLREIPYRDMFVRKPEIVYLNIIKKSLPKNSLSDQYLKRVHIFRGPTHTFKKLPQFAPDINDYEGLPEIDLMQLVKKSPNAQLIDQSIPGLDKQMFGRELPKATMPELPKYRLAPAVGKRRAESIIRQHKRFVRRYEAYRIKRRVRVENPDLRMIMDERKAKNMPEYADLVDEDAFEEDEEIVKDVWEDDGTEQPPKPEKPAAAAAGGKPAATGAAGKPAAGGAPAGGKPADKKPEPAKKPEAGKKPEPAKKPEAPKKK